MAPLSRGRDGVWLDFVADLLAAPLTSWPGEQVSRLFVETFSAFGCEFYRSESGGPPTHQLWPRERFAPYLDELLVWAEHDAPTRHPLLRYYRATADCRPMQVDDVPDRYADARVVAGWRELGRHWGGVQAQLSIPLAAGPRTNRAFVVGREDAYMPREMVSTHRLQRLLVGLDRQIDAYARWSDRNGVAGTDGAQSVGLTPRELAVLELLADGLTATAIGRRLTIAERTVQKHLQHAYSKLGVADRLTAVRRAQTMRVLPNL